MKKLKSQHSVLTSYIVIGSESYLVRLLPGVDTSKDEVVQISCVLKTEKMPDI